MTLGSHTGTRTESPLRERLRVLLLARVLIMSVFLAGAGALWFGKPQVTRALLGNATFSVIALAYVGTLLSAFLVRSISRPVLLAYLQIVFDVLLITGAVGAMRGASGPMALLYVLPIANAAGLLLVPGAIAAAVASSAAYAALLLHGQHVVMAIGGLPVPEVAWPITLASICFALTAVGVGGAARRLASAEGELQSHRAEVGRLEDLHRTLANGLECGILVVDCDGRVRSANPAAQQILALPIGSIHGREISWLLPLLDSAERDTEPGGFVECAQRVGAGDSRRLRVGRNSLHDTYGNTMGELVMLQDVTRIEQLEARLAENEGAPLVLDDDAETDEEGANKEGSGGEDGLIGSCAEMAQISRLIDKVAAADATVLVTGESGTGKELVARAIHRRSPRSEGPFVVVNCGAIPESLIESELFGHVRGAFTGAIADRAGLFRRAHGGTIFLDEIGELSAALQVRLLRVLQDHRVLPVGSTTATDVDVRVVAATNRVLEDLVKSGEYREDLYYRLAVISIDVLPLRERGKDLAQLIEYFLRQGAERHGKNVKGVSARAMALLLRHPYAGNVRELENVIEHAITLADRDTVQERDLPESVRGVMPARSARPSAAEATVLAMSGSLPPSDELVAAAGPDPWSDEAGAGVSEQSGEPVRLPIDEGEGASLDEQLARQEKEMLLAALDRASGVKKKAAALLGINYRSFRHRLQKYALDSHGDSVLSRADRGTLPRETPH